MIFCGPQTEADQTRDNRRAGKVENAKSKLPQKILDFDFYYFSQRCKLKCVSVLGLLGPSLCEALWLAALLLWHPVAPSFLLNSSTFNLMTVLSVCLSVCLKQPRLMTSFILYSFYLSFSFPYLVFPHGWFVIIHSPPLVKRIRLAINARLDKAGVAVWERRAQRTQTLLLLAEHDIIPFVWPLAGCGLGTCSLAVWR